MTKTPHFSETFRGKKILVTGHSGFKGSWLTFWLSQMGAKVSGISLEPNTEPNLCTELKLPSKCQSFFVDVRKQAEFKKTIEKIQPEIIFHLAAQPLVRFSYEDPLGTLNTNVMGTAYLMDAMRNLPGLKGALVVTTDKVYKNPEHNKPFTEDESLGGEDLYSASKACSEHVVHAYTRSFFRDVTKGPVILTARGGNVVGGGDWSANRLIPDVVRAKLKGETLTLRFPHAIRPWQHVLDCLHGYLSLMAHALIEPSKFHTQSFNIGPDVENSKSVGEVIETMRSQWGPLEIKIDPAALLEKPESQYLRLSTEKIEAQIGWKPCLNYQQTIAWTTQWYKRFAEGESAEKICLEQLREYKANGL